MSNSFARGTLWVVGLTLILDACGSGTALTPTTSASEAVASPSLSITSPAVVDGALLEDYKCEIKQNDVEASIPLAWSGVPSEATSVAITMHHYPNPDDTVRANSYLAIWDLDPSTTAIGHGEAGDGDWFLGSNKDGTAISYTSPCSQGGGESHEYTITLYALSETPTDLPRESSIDIDRDALVASLETVTILDSTTLTFTS